MDSQSMPAPVPIGSVAELERVGKMLADTDLFGTRNPAEGFVIASVCQQEGMSYMRWTQNFHLIKGRVTKRADAMQADFMRGGGSVEVRRRDAEGSVAVFSFGKSSYESRVLWEEIKREPFAQGQNYATPRKRMQMMWARCVSDGIRTVAPQFVQGVYTPEEAEAFETPQQSVAEAMRPAAAAEPDPSVCPIGKSAGMRWRDMDEASLSAAQSYDSPALTAAHKAAIGEALAEKRRERRQDGADSESPGQPGAGAEAE